MHGSPWENAFTKSAPLHGRTGTNYQGRNLCRNVEKSVSAMLTSLLAHSPSRLTIISCIKQDAVLPRMVWPLPRFLSPCMLELRPDDISTREAAVRRLQTSFFSQVGVSEPTKEASLTKKPEEDSCEQEKDTRRSAHISKEDMCVPSRRVIIHRSRS